jgi:phosphoribosylaminoimidazole carboxylase (NCAIR synthetase)
MDTSKMIKAYCLKMQDAVVTKTAKGGYMAGGHDGKGNKMAAIMSEAKALQAIADGVATKGF